MILNIKNISNFYLMDIVPLPNIYNVVGRTYYSNISYPGKGFCFSRISFPYLVV